MDAETVVSDRYHLRERLGTGGMGTVWRAHDARLHREVALKEIVVGSGPHTNAARALAEARSAARLDHPNIVTVHDAIEDGNRIWIVMSLVDGRNLEEAVKSDGPLPPDKAAQVAESLLAALDAAHAAGIVHRDVKPSNVLLPRSGGVMLTDFSIAAAEEMASQTGTGVVLGTPGYVAPERMTTGETTTAVDMFGLGATLFFATEGRPPFARETALAAYYATVNEPHPRPVRAGPLADVVDGLLAKLPRERWNSARVRAAMLQPGTRPAPPEPAPDVAPRERRNVLLPLGVGLAVLLVIGTTTVTLMNRGTNSATGSQVPSSVPGAADSVPPSPIVTSSPTASPPQILPPVTPRRLYYGLGCCVTYWDANGGRWHFFDGGTYTDGDDNSPRRISHGDAAAVSETNAGKTRTTTTTFDAAGRMWTVATVSDDGATPVDTSTTTYDAASGQIVQMTSGTVSVNREYDQLGRPVKYTDADAGITTFEYDRYGRPVRTVDPTGTITYGYDRGIEPRGMLTSLADSNTGTMTARYSPDGQLTTVGYPGGITRTDTLDANLKPVARQYTRDSDSFTLYSESVTDNAHGQWATHAYTGGSKTFTYDRLGHLTKVAHTDSGGQCTIRTYEFAGTTGSRTNRTAKKTWLPGFLGACDETGIADATTSYTYDSADRLVTDTSGAYTYDQYGRTTTLPGGLTNAFYANDKIASQTLGDNRLTWTLDPSICAAVSALLSLGVGAYKVFVKGDKSGWLDIAGAATFGVAKGLKMVNDLRKANAIKGLPKNVRDMGTTFKRGRSAVAKAYQGFNRRFVKPADRIDKAYGAFNTGKFIYDEYTRVRRTGSFW